MNLGVTAIKYDSRAGVATIVIGENEILRIDFQTWRERLGIRKDSSATADETVTEAKTTTKTGYKLYDSFFSDIEQRESSGRNSVMSRGNYGFVGRYQIGEQALADIGLYPKQPPKSKYPNTWKHEFLPNEYGIKSIDDFKKSPDKQKEIFIKILKKNWEHIENDELDEYIGKTINIRDACRCAFSRCW